MQGPGVWRRYVGGLRMVLLCAVLALLASGCQLSWPPQWRLESLTGSGESPAPAAVDPGDRVLQRAELLDAALEAEELDLVALEALAAGDDAIGYLAAVELGRVLAARQRDGAVYLRHALMLLPEPELAVELALHLQQLDRTDEAIDCLMTLRPWAPVAEDMLRLGADPAAVLEVLEGERAWTTIRRVVAEGLAPGLERERAHLRAIGAAGRYAEALPGLAELWQRDDSDELVAWWYARCLEGTGQLEAAADIYLEAGQLGAYRRGMVLERLGRAEMAADAYAASDHPEAQWRAGRLLESLNRQQDALNVYLDLARSGDAPAAGDAAYRALHLLGDAEDDRAEELHQLLQRHPVWSERLGLKPLWPLRPPVKSDVPSFIHRAQALLDAGQPVRAQLELAIAAHHASGPLALALGEWYVRQGEYHRAVAIGITALESWPCPRAYRLAYPRAFWDPVSEAASRHMVDPLLVLAVIRQESMYRADAVSWAGAMGLMQVMPATGADIARALGRDYQANMLLDPETSIEFGAYYIAAMLRQFGGDLDRALAAYNAGAGNVHRWMAMPGGRDPLTFPATITYIETRQYLTRVTNSYLTYRWLYGDD